MRSSLALAVLAVALAAAGCGGTSDRPQGTQAKTKNQLAAEKLLKTEGKLPCSCRSEHAGLTAATAATG